MLLFVCFKKAFFNVSVNAGFINNFNVRFKANFNITFDPTLMLILMLD